MLAKVYSGAVVGVDAYSVEIEVNAGGGTPEIVIVGLPDAAVKESKDRVHTALVNSAFLPPKGRSTVNLAPADVKKEGPSFDLPIALGMIANCGDLDAKRLEDLCVIGELALSGEVRRVRGVLPIAMNARNAGLKGIIVPHANAAEAAVVDGLAVYPVETLREAADFLNGDLEIDPREADLGSVFEEYSGYLEDFADVKGQESAKRAIEVAVAGGHNILCMGPPGTGKSMLAKRVPSVLPPLTLEEALEVTRIHSIAGSLPPEQPLIARRPFRTPHHTISDAGLLGGGTNPMPGEVSLAHHGILFLDELPEFKRNVLEVMRQPLEDGSVTIVRAAASVKYPSRFMMVAAMNPCPCGYYGDPQRECRCTPHQIQRYRNKISGPLLDRIDIHIEVPAVQYRQLTSLEKGEPSQDIRKRILAAREAQQQRFQGDSDVYCNSDMRARDLQKYCRLDEESQQKLKMAIHELNFSARAYNRILKVSRTIADLESRTDIRPEHIYEAVQYRTLDKQMWV